MAPKFAYFFFILISSEVTIHVCDEVKSVSRDFSCPQKLLVAKMGYFADVTAGQRLEDMDISVHCDLQIFDWLMRWVKRETVSQEMWPRLDPTNVVPILVSASFLQVMFGRKNKLANVIYTFTVNFLDRWNHS